MRTRRLERIGGVLGGMLGLTALGAALFAPLGTTCIDTTNPGMGAGCHPTSVLQIEGLANLAFAITLFGGLSLGVLLFAVWHSVDQRLAALVLLWGCTVLLWGATLLAALSIGVLFLPADALALVASIAGTVAASQRTAATV
jgi:hypothetical protein